MSKKIKLPKLPALLERKIYKTGQTRGADDDEIYQNRVGRNGTVLIPFDMWPLCRTPGDGTASYENGYIVLIPPFRYFSDRNIAQTLKQQGLEIGKNALVFYETRSAWNTNNPDKLGWRPAQSRLAPLRGHYVARIPATTAIEDGGKIIRGFETTSNKGAGIRVYEYASTPTLVSCRIQLEALFWLCPDALTVAQLGGMEAADAETRKRIALNTAEETGLLIREKLKCARIINKDHVPVCPLCLEVLSAKGFVTKMEQAAGREVLDLTVTQLNLFHINELRVGKSNHTTYNLGWGHHHCNAVVKDSGISETIKWMKAVLERNKDYSESAS